MSTMSEIQADEIVRNEIDLRHQEMYERMRPSAIFRPGLSIDGNKWCALYGLNLQDGVAGFGDSPADAMSDFDSEWEKPLKTEADQAEGEK